MLSHVDLFSGLGGFALAAKWNGIETIQFVEIDKRCREFLSKAWPGVAICEDVRDFHWTGRRPFLLTAGVPCQPVSCAGKRKGKADDRWLWPEALRVVSEVRPRWALFENPTGINGLGLDGILADLEALGYEVAPPLIIPACAVNSPQLRKRYWIVAYASGEERRQKPGGPSGYEAAHEGWTEEHDHGPGGDVKGRCRHWDSYRWLACADGKFRRAPDDAFGMVDGVHRSLLAALGNSIVPQVAAEIIAAMLRADMGGDIDV